MNKSTKIIIGVIVAAFIALFAWAIIHNSSESYDPNSVIATTKYSGGIAEHVLGNPDAPVVIIEYSDFQCSGCAAHVDAVDELVEKYGDDLAVVRRSYVLSYHENAFAAACAAEAAGLQGYWKAYGDYLFENQADWFYSDETERYSQFLNYFETVTNGEGDVVKFLSDFASSEVKAKVNFDISLANRVKDRIDYTPAFFLDGEVLDFAYEGNPDKLPFVDYMSQKIDAKLATLAETEEE